MEIIRNFINISGISNTGELPNIYKGQLIQYSDTETIFIPKGQPDIKSIFQILINTEIKSSRCISTPVGNTVVIDGIKKLKIMYTLDDSSGKANFVDMELPFNAFFEQQNNIDLRKVSIHVLDAYFSLIDGRRIYSHYLFMVNIPEVSSDFDKTSELLKDISAKYMEEAALIDLDAG